MTTPWLRTFLMLAALAVALLTVRPALAYAPFCDPRAATSIAPPPFTSIPDLRWESPAPLLQQWCERLEAARSLERDPAPARDHLSNSSSKTWPDVASPHQAVPLPRRQAASRVPCRFIRCSGQPGSRSRVYRPPR